MGQDGGQTFEVNGQTYSSLDEVPQPYRDSIAALLADGDGDGVPDAFQTGASTQHIVHTVNEFQVDGVTYSSIDDIPEPQRSAVADAFGRSDSIPVPTRAAGSQGVSAARGPSPIVTKAGWSGRTKLLAAFMAIDAVIAGAVIWVLTR